MSEYFRVLKRLQAQEADGVAALPRLPSARSDVARAPAAEPGRVRRAAPAAPARPAPLVTPAYATLYDNLRASANGRPTRTVVFAGVSAGDPVRAAADGLARHLRGLTLRVLAVELNGEGGRTILRARAEAGITPPHALESTPLDLSSRASAEQVEGWLHDRTGDADLVLIEGPPLAASIDAALLSCACDGLVLVAQPGATPREALAVAGERVRAVGCRTFGIVLFGADERLPAWARRWLQPHRPRTLSEVP